jgi:hypothetical protein
MVLQRETGRLPLKLHVNVACDVAKLVRELAVELALLVRRGSAPSEK